MKIRSLLTIVAMFSLLLFGVGTAHAVLGVNDAVPGTDTVIPIICSVDFAANGTDTLWAIADTSQGAVAFPDSTAVVKEKLFVFDITSVQVFDDTASWTKLDVLSDACSLIVARMNAAQKLSLRVSLDPILGIYVKDTAGPFYMGYVTYTGQTTGNGIPPSDRFVSWAYLVDLPEGFASGYDPFSVERGIAPHLNEGGLAGAPTPISAESIFPRYFFMNANSGTLNWWVILTGRNEYALADPFFSTHRVLDCQICNEEEKCTSQPIPIPFELTVIDVSHYVPASLINSTGKFAGFAACHIVESGNIIQGGNSVPVTLTGTIDHPAKAVIGGSGYYTLKGWSFQREQASSAALSWDAFQEMHRLYCQAFQGNNPQTGAPCNVQ